MQGSIWRFHFYMHIDTQIKMLPLFFREKSHYKALRFIMTFVINISKICGVYRKTSFVWKFNRKPRCHDSSFYFLKAKYICTVCAYVYDEEQGDPESGIAPGTKWEDVPEDYLCPLCKVGKEYFEKQADRSVCQKGAVKHRQKMRLFDG